MVTEPIGTIVGTWTIDGEHEVPIFQNLNCVPSRALHHRASVETLLFPPSPDRSETFPADQPLPVSSLLWTILPRCPPPSLVERDPARRCSKDTISFEPIPPHHSCTLKQQKRSFLSLGSFVPNLHFTVRGLDFVSRDVTPTDRMNQFRRVMNPEVFTRNLFKSAMKRKLKDTRAKLHFRNWFLIDLQSEWKERVRSQWERERDRRSYHFGNLSHAHVRNTKFTDHFD